MVLEMVRSSILSGGCNSPVCWPHWVAIDIPTKYRYTVKWFFRECHRASHRRLGLQRGKGTDLVTYDFAKFGARYQIGGGVRSEENFFGREAELQITEGNLPGNFVVIGGRKQGKTSFLKAIARRSKSWGWDSYYVHAHKDFLGDGLAEIWSQHSSLRRTAGSLEARVDRPPIILIDEAQELIGQDESQQREIFLQLSALCERKDGRRCVFGLAGDWILAESAAQGRPFYNFGRKIKIGGLDRASAELMVRHLEKENWRYESQSLCDRIVFDSGSQAYLIAMICSGVLEAKRNTDGGLDDVILRHHDLDRVLGSFSIRDEFRGWRTGIQSLGFQWAVGLIEKMLLRDRPFSIQSVIEEEGRGIGEVSEIQDFLTFLELNGWLLKGNPEEHYFLPLFKREALRFKDSRSIAVIPSGGQHSSANRRFRVALSFSGKNRTVVEHVARVLTEQLGEGKVFYDNFFRHEIARLNLDKYLTDIYRKHSDLVVVFLSPGYEQSDWCGLEWRAVRDLIKNQLDGVVMPVLLEKLDITTLLSIDGYLAAEDESPEAIAAFILKRLEFES